MNWKKLLNISELKNVSNIGFALIVGNAISAFFWLYVAKLLNVEDYGQLNYFIANAAIVSSICMWGSEKAVTVYTAKSIPIQSTVYFISMLSGIIGFTVLYILFSDLGMSLYSLGYIFYNLALAELIGRKLYKQYSKYFIIQKICFVFISVILYYFIGIEGILIGYGLSFFIFFKQIYVSFKSTKIDFTLLKPRFNFISNNYLLDLVKASKGQIDKLIVGPLFSFVLLGNYSLGLQVVSVLTIIPGAVFKYTLTEDSSGKSTGKIKLFSLLVSILLALVGIFLMPILISSFFEEYKDTVDLIPIMSLSVIPSTVSSNFISKFLGLEKSKFVMIGYAIYLLSMILGIFTLVTQYGTLGLALSYLISSSTQAIYFIGLNYFWKNDKFEKH